MHSDHSESQVKENLKEANYQSFLKFFAKDFYCLFEFGLKHCFLGTLQNPYIQHKDAYMTQKLKEQNVLIK